MGEDLSSHEGRGVSPGKTRSLTISHPECLTLLGVPPRRPESAAGCEAPTSGSWHSGKRAEYPAANSLPTTVDRRQGGHTGPVRTSSLPETPRERSRKDDPLPRHCTGDCARNELEAAPGFEPGNKGFAVPRLTTWPRRLTRGGEAITLHRRTPRWAPSVGTRRDRPWNLGTERTSRVGHTPA